MNKLLEVQLGGSTRPDSINPSSRVVVFANSYARTTYGLNKSNMTVASRCSYRGIPDLGRYANPDSPCLGICRPIFCVSQTSGLAVRNTKRLKSPSDPIGAVSISVTARGPTRSPIVVCAVARRKTGVSARSVPVGISAGICCRRDWGQDKKSASDARSHNSKDDATQLRAALHRTGLQLISPHRLLRQTLWAKYHQASRGT